MQRTTATTNGDEIAPKPDNYGTLEADNDGGDAGDAEEPESKTEAEAGTELEGEKVKAAHGINCLSCIYHSSFPPDPSLFTRA